ncbi:NACHT domain-containing protein [Pedobacter jeongneungensis]|uniref:NACHT domain-containing protein n=1 Tax=Pedobacter jeongneungensis TaxID=947309 RepID=UPI0004694919|nr:NACHT domain-containing protein [Pedobacter jeongneungensis]
MRHFLPLEIKDGVFQQHPNFDNQIVFDESESEQYDQMFARHFHFTVADVVLAGAFYGGAKILSPNKDIDDTSFIEVDPDGIPLQYLDKSISKPSKDWVEAYLMQTKKSENFYHTLFTHLDNHYITPFLKFSSSLVPDLLSYKKLSTYSRLLILGGPGSGKTSLMRKLTFELLKINEKNGNGTLLPVYIQLRDLNFDSHANNIHKYFTSLYSQIDPAYAVSTEREGRFLFLFDGLDEIEHRHVPKFMQWIDFLEVQKKSYRIYISSRDISALKSKELKKFEKIRIEPFSQSQILEYCHRLIDDRYASKQFYNTISENKSLLSLLSNPLLLSLSIGVFLTKKVFPNNLTLLVQEVVNHLTDNWDLNRNINRYQNLNSSLTKSFLSRLSYFLHTNHKYKFSVKEADGIKPMKLEGIDMTEILGEIKETTGLLNIMNGQWSFSHVFFQEFFCANYLIDRSSSIKDDYTLYKQNKNWINVWNQAIEFSSDPEFYVHKDAAQKGELSLYLNRLLTILRRSDYLDANLYEEVLKQITELISVYNEDLIIHDLDEEVIVVSLRKKSSLKIEILEEILRNALVKNPNRFSYDSQDNLNNSMFGKLIIKLLMSKDEFFLTRTRNNIILHRTEIH